MGNLRLGVPDVIEELCLIPHDPGALVRLGIFEVGNRPRFAAVEPIEHRTDPVLCRFSHIMARRAFLELNLAGADILYPAQTARRDDCCSQTRLYHLPGSLLRKNHFHIAMRFRAFLSNFTNAVFASAIESDSCAGLEPQAVFLRAAVIELELARHPLDEKPQRPPGVK